MADVVDAMARQHMTNDIVEAISKDVGSIVDEMQTWTRGGSQSSKKQDAEHTRRTDGTSYADAARRTATPTKAARDEQAGNSHPTNYHSEAEGINLEDYDLAKLNERELTEKANLALAASDSSRMSRQPEVLGSTEDEGRGHETSMLTVVAEYVPINFNPNKKGSLLSIEQEGGLDKGSIRSAGWIRPPERRSPSQQYVHMKIRFEDKNQANKAIRDGLFIRGKMITIRKDIQEPLICYKCHSIVTATTQATVRLRSTIFADTATGHRSAQCPTLRINGARTARNPDMAQVTGVAKSDSNNLRHGERRTQRRATDTSWMIRIPERGGAGAHRRGMGTKADEWRRRAGTVNASRGAEGYGGG
ncbi:RNA-directed DNA polymerase from transposon X-element [Salix suchowensis]|nr:RNA-directed DNA polymerase from transposon X-element [Salix suchowensis]